jgi:ComF family protein
MQPLYEFAVPRSCAGCGSYLETPTHRVCPICAGRLKPVLPGDLHLIHALQKLKQNAPVIDLHALYYYEKDGVLQTLVHQLKYNGMRQLGRALGVNLGGEIAAALEHPAAAVIVPVPLHKAKLRERGYNQAMYIGEGVSSVLGVPVLSGILRRVRYTESQTSLTPEERKANVRGAFAVPRSSQSAVKGRRIFLVDDVLTTGSTFSECAETLVRAGAVGVCVCALGLAVS